MFLLLSGIREAGADRQAGVNVNAVYAAHTGSWEADTAVNIVGADRGVMGF